MPYEFQTLQNNFFQPENIFQLDQPVRSAEISNFPVEPDKSPTTVLDLGSGTIEQSSFKIESRESAVWDFHTSPVKQEHNSSPIQEIRENFTVNKDDFSNQICSVPIHEEFSNHYYKDSNIESSCRFQCAPHMNQSKESVQNSQSIPNYSHLTHSCSETRLSCENDSFPTYPIEVTHYGEKFSEPVYNHCDPFSVIDISQLDYSNKNVYSNVNSLESSGIMEDESIFPEFSTNQTVNESHCYSQNNFQSYMFLPQH